MRRPEAWLLAAALLVTACAGQSQPMGAPVREAAIVAVPESESGGTGQAIVAEDGYALPLRRWLPDGEPKAVILALHGFNDYSAGFELPGTRWAEAGVAVYAFDQRGFGAAARPGIWADTPTFVADARTALALIAGKHAGTPLFLLGESMGGSVAVLSRADDAPAAAAPPLDGLILISPALAGRNAFPLYQRLGLRAVAALAPGFRVTGEGLELQPSDNIEVLRDMWFDPLTIKDARLDTLAGLLDLTLAAAEEASTIGPPLDDAANPPVLMIYGGNEQVVPLRAIARTLAPYSSRWKAAPAWRLGYYPAGYHMLLRDTQAEIIWTDVLAWMDDATAPLPSGADRGAWESLLENAWR